MNDIEKLRAMAKEVKDHEKLDIVYDEILMPRLIRAASIHKRSELQITDNCHDSSMGSQLEQIMGRKVTLQDLVEKDMKPYLEEKGYNIGICSPSYFVYIRW